jgi:hypothetical protein
MLQRPYKIEQLKVMAYKSPSRKGAAERFDFLINPDNITSRHNNEFSRQRGINTSGRTATYILSDTDQLSFQLLLDNSLSKEFLPGLPSESSTTVKVQVDKFLRSCFYMDGDIHEPLYLLVQWGGFSFECRLKSVSVSYSHFNSQGEPIRAKLDVLFVEDMPSSKRIRLENKKSPDITHSRTTLQGQTLTGLSKDVYGDASLYLTIAEANLLNHFRRLKPGGELHFPPLEK